MAILTSSRTQRIYLRILACSTTKALSLLGDEIQEEYGFDESHLVRNAEQLEALWRSYDARLYALSRSPSR